MSREVEHFIFEGIPYGDGECLCFAVDGATFKSMTGEEPDEMDLFSDWLVRDEPELQGKYRLYPGSLFSSEHRRFEVRSWKG